MKLQIEVTSKEEAHEAIEVLSAYLGKDFMKRVDELAKTIEQTDEPKKSTVKTTKAAPAKKAEPKPEPETEDEDEPQQGQEIDLAALTQIAKEAVERTDRGTAKDVISKYGAKLSEVDEGDYIALAAELQALGA